MIGLSEQINISFKRTTTGNYLANKMGKLAIAYWNSIHPSAQEEERIETRLFSGAEVMVMRVEIVRVGVRLGDSSHRT